MSAMDLPSIAALAVGLAMDATAVSAARGAAAKELRARDVAVVALYFGGFQAAMPLLGWAVGALVGPYVQAYGHFVACALLAALGLKMLKEARDSDPADDASVDDALFSHRVLLALAVATSIDAFAVGITLPMLRAPMALSLAIIGLTTAATSALGMLIGRKVGAAVGRRMDVAGGLVLIGLGVKILVQGLRGG